MKALANAPTIALNELYKNTTNEDERKKIMNYARRLNIKIDDSYRA